MLHAIDDQGNIWWHCHTHDCDHHNCANWDGARCATHHELAHTDKPQGQSLTAHVAHQDITYTEPGLVALPKCSCGSQMAVRVQFTEEELRPPQIYRDSRGTIVKVVFAGPTAYSILSHLERDHAGKLFSVCDDVVLNPAITRHQELHRQLQAIGKKHTPEEDVS